MECGCSGTGGAVRVAVDALASAARDSCLQRASHVADTGRGCVDSQHVVVFAEDLCGVQVEIQGAIFVRSFS